METLDMFVCLLYSIHSNNRANNNVEQKLYIYMHVLYLFT
jgi:hypothetical protein